MLDYELESISIYENNEKKSNSRTSATFKVKIGCFKKPVVIISREGNNNRL